VKEGKKTHNRQSKEGKTDKLTDDTKWVTLHNTVVLSALVL
jgi:hypothetical protein